MCTKNQAISILHEVYNACNPIFGANLKEGYLYGSYVVFFIDNFFKDFEIKDTINVIGKLRPGETATVEVSWNSAKAEAKEQRLEFLW